RRRDEGARRAQPPHPPQPPPPPQPLPQLLPLLQLLPELQPLPPLSPPVVRGGIRAAWRGESPGWPARPKIPTTRASSPKLWRLPSESILASDRWDSRSQSR